MSDDLWNISASAGDGTSGNASPQAEQGAGSQPKYLTHEEMLRLMDERETKIIQRAQALTDKASSRLEREWKKELEAVNRAIDYQKAAGIEISDAQRQAIQLQAFNKMIAKEETSDTHSAPTSPPSGETQPSKVNPAAVIAEGIFDAYGTRLEKNDPEFSEVDQSSRAAFVKTLTAAVQKKAQRLSTSPASRIPTLGQGNPPSVEGLTQQYKTEMRSNRGKGMKVANEIKEKYRAKGVDVDRVNLYS